MKLANRYEVVRELGRGGMGVVYLAKDPILDREVAVKVIGHMSDDRKQRFLREARVIAKMDHPGIVGAFDLGEDGEGLFFVMPFVPGVNLRQVLSGSPLELRQLVDLGIQAGEALEYSHQLGIVHRDVKPENIMVSHLGESLRIRITDFGLAINPTEQRMTTTGALVGTVSYLSPEQVVGGGAVDQRVDVYALGTVLYECIAGRTPFKGEIQSVLFRIVHEEPQPLSQLVVEIDPELEALVLSCLAKDPAKRPAKAGDVAAALARYRKKIADTARAAEALRTVEMRGLTAPQLQASPFVGRREELAELQNRLNAAVTGESQLVLVEGEAGVGKTRLVEELERLAHARAFRVLSASFNEQDGAQPYQGFCDIFEAHLRRASAAGSSAADLGELEDELVALFPILGELRGKSKTPKPAPVPHEDRTAVFDVLARALARVAGEEPLVVVLEDLHLAPVSAEALQYIARRLGPTHVLLLGTYIAAEIDRAHPLTKLVDGLSGNKRFALVRLARFTPDEHKSFLATVSLGAHVDETLATRLYEASEGNPFFSRELFRALLDTGSITREAQGSYQLSGGMSLALDSVPATVHKAVERRLERLPDELRQVLRLASVLGKSFEEHELEAILDEDDDLELDDALDKLVRGGFIEEQRKGRGDRLAFTSGTMREVLYAELPRRKRRGLHRKVAEHLEAKHAGKLDRVRPQLVHHYAQADVADKVIAYGLEVARAALAAFSADEAIRAAKSVLGFVEDAETAPVEAEARTLLAGAYRIAGDFDAALKELEAAIRLHEKAGAAQALAGYVDAALLAWEGRRVADAKRWVDKGIKAARNARAARAAGAAPASDRDTGAAALGKLLPLGITIANLRADAATARELLEESERLKREHAPEPAAAAAATGGTVRVAIVGKRRAVEPAACQVFEDTEVLANAFETLLTMDDHGNIVPKLAELWESDGGGQRFRFTLRADATWHDGTPVTAADVKASLEHAAATTREQPPLAIAALRGADAIEVTGATTLTFHLAEPLALFPALLTAFQTAVARPGGPLPVGTGPFRATAIAGDRVAFVRHDSYWGPRPAVDALEYRVVSAATTLAADLRAGKHDIVTGLPPNDVDELLRDRRTGTRSIERPKKSTCFAVFRHGSALGGDDAVRAALFGSVATNDLVWRHIGRLGRPAEGLIPPGILGHDAGRRHSVMSHERALELMASRGVTAEAPAKLRVAVHPLLLQRHRGFLDALFEAWHALHVEVELPALDMDAFFATLANPAEREVDVTILRWRADYDDPDGMTYALFDSEVGTLRGYAATPALDRAQRDARLEASPQKRIAMYRQIEEGLLAQHAVLPLWHEEDLRIYGPRVDAIALQSTPPYVDYAAVAVRETSGTAMRRTGGTLTCAFDVARVSMDPTHASINEEFTICGAVYEGLTREVGGAQVVPWLARTIAVEDGGRRYRIVLRDNVRFHDGRPLGARDVRYTFEHALRHGDRGYASQFTGIVGAREVIAGTRNELAGFRIHAPNELSIELESPQPAFAALLALPTVMIIPEGSRPSGKHSYRDGLVGTGPFRVARFEPERRLELEANPFYWRPGLPRSPALVFQLGMPSQEVVARLRTGQLAIAYNPEPTAAAPLWNDPAFASGCRTVPALATYALVFNIHRPPFDDAGLRRGVARALDIDALARGLGRTISPARTLVPPGLLGHDVGRPRAHGGDATAVLDVEAALLVAPVFRTRYAGYARALIEALAATGVRVKTQREGLPAQHGRDSDLYLGRWVADYPDVDTFTSGTLQSAAGSWGNMVGGPELDRLVDQVRFEPDPSVREAACRDIEALLHDEAYFVPLFHDGHNIFTHQSVRGLADVIATSSGALDFSTLAIED